jgi:hypothetical protein
MRKEYFDGEKPEIASGVFGIDFMKRCEAYEDNHALVMLFLEDDEHYWEICTFSSAWLETLIKLLETAKQRLQDKKRFLPEKDNGYRFIK